MSISIKRWLDAHPKTRQWMWFALLWVGGLTAALVLAYPFKWLIKQI